MDDLIRVGPDEKNILSPTDMIPEGNEPEEHDEDRGDETDEEDDEDDYERSCPSPGMHELFIEKTADRITFRAAISAADDPLWVKKFSVLWASFVQVVKANNDIDRNMVENMKNQKRKDVGVA